MSSDEDKPDGMAIREKFWDERSPEEKLEALRYELLNALNVARAALDLAERLKSHEHGAKGDVMFSANARFEPAGFRRRTPTSLTRSND